MQKINSAPTLRNAIVELEMEHAQEGKLLKQQFQIAYESIKPFNLIKSTLKDAADSPDLRTGILNTSIGLATGYLSKLLFVNVSHNLLRKTLGFALQFGIARVVAKNPGLTKSVGQGLFSIIRRVMTKRIQDPVKQDIV